MLNEHWTFPVCEITQLKLCFFRLGNELCGRESEIERSNYFV